MKRPIVYATVCSGIEAMSVAVEPLGWRPLWFSEIAPAPCAVLSHHYPLVPNLGDMLKIRGKDYEGKIDVLAGGTPCQSFSNFGKKGGLADPRGQLSPAFARLAHATRAPWLLWENVPGALWCDGGRSFAQIMSAFTGRKVEVPGKGWKSAGIIVGAKGRYSIAWRVLDSQYVRVAGYDRALPQSRKRVWLVGHRGEWSAPAEILIGRKVIPEVPRPLRLPANTDTVADAGSTSNPIVINGNVIDRTPDNHYVRRSKGWKTGVAFTCLAKLPNCICDDTGVRRCTPVEYERMMGFSDNYTLVPNSRGQPMGDYARMSALGNSWPVNCARFVCDRIDKYIRGELRDE